MGMGAVSRHPRAPFCACPRIAGCNHIGYTCGCGDQEFSTQGIERFFATGAMAGIQAKYADRLRLIPGRLNVSASVRDMNLPGLELHELHGSRKGA